MLAPSTAEFAKSLFRSRPIKLAICNHSEQMCAKYRTLPKTFTQKSDESYRLDLNPPPHLPHRTNRNGTAPPRINEEKPAPNLQTPMQRRRPRRTPIHTQFTWHSVGVSLFRTFFSKTHNVSCHEQIIVIFIG